MSADPNTSSNADRFQPLPGRPEPLPPDIVQQAADGIVPEPPAAVRVAQFHRDLIQQTPHVWVTWCLLAANIAVWLVMVASGVHFFSPAAEDLVRWGADFGPKTINGEWWRLITAAFIHIGILHLALNMWCLWGLGCLMERLVGHVGCLALYLACAAAGSIASLAWNPNLVSAGASGAVFGLAGGLLGFMLRAKGVIPMQALQQIRGSMVGFIGYNLFFGMTVKGIDNAAHIGGLIMGFLCGLVLAAPLTPEATRRRWLRNAGVCLMGMVPVIGGFEKLPRLADMGAELQAFGTVESQALEALNSNLSKAQTGALTDTDFAAAIRRESLDPWRAATDRLEGLTSISSAQRPLYDALLAYAQRREEAFRVMADAAEVGDAVKFQEGSELMRQANELAQGLTARFGQ